MLSNFKKFNKTLASTPLPPQLHPELHRGIDPVGSLPASAGWPTALTTTWRGSAVPGCWQGWRDQGSVPPFSPTDTMKYRAKYGALNTNLLQKVGGIRPR